jgi:formylglycine-generating enzyme required for sulfatase activity
MTSIRTLLAFCLLTPSLVHGAGGCPRDAVRVGAVCVDRYEASVWQIPPTNKPLLKKVLAGRVTAADLTDGGAVLIGCQLVPDAVANYPANFPNGGQWTPVPGSDPPSPGVYAVSVPGVRPTTCTSWYRASQACRLSGKRLPRNDEWQDAAAGTPDPGLADDGTTTCNTTRLTSATDLVPTGSRADCKSSWGAFDMIGNAAEWVADWSPLADACNGPSGSGSKDTACVGASAVGGVPAALVRGGNFLDGEGAGVFNVRGDFSPGFGDVGIGFRCAR